MTICCRCWHGHFGPGQSPPADAFWSVTMYDKRQLFTANPVNRFAIGDRDALKFNRCRRPFVSPLAGDGPGPEQTNAVASDHKGERMSYPLLNIFWTMFEFFLWLAWIWILVMVVFDIFRSRDLSGWAKALWIVFVAVIPLIGVLVYVIARGDAMHDRTERQAMGQDEAFRGSVRQAASTSPADQLVKLADLRERGVITAEEFSREKEKVLA